MRQHRGGLPGSGGTAVRAGDRHAGGQHLLPQAGAAAVAVGTANFRNPYAMPEIIGGLEKYMEENGIRDLKEIRGIVS